MERLACITKHGCVAFALRSNDKGYEWAACENTPGRSLLFSVALLRIGASFRVTSRRFLRIISVSKGIRSNEKAKEAKHQSSGSAAVE
jgi:hypothetical protein